MSFLFSQVPIFDRILSYLEGREMINFRIVNQSVYQMFSIPSNYSIYERKKQAFYQRLICNIGHYYLNSVEISVGGQIVDRQYGEWMQIWHELNHLRVNRLII